MRFSPRFSLRLMLLVVAILAMICAWRHEFNRKDLAEREGIRVELESKLLALEHARDAIYDSIQFRLNMDSVRVRERTDAIRAEIAATQKLLKSLGL